MNTPNQINEEYQIYKDVELMLNIIKPLDFKDWLKQWDGVLTESTGQSIFSINLTGTNRKRT